MMLSVNHPSVLINTLETKVLVGNSTKITQELQAFNFFFIEEIWRKFLIEEFESNQRQDTFDTYSDSSDIASHYLIGKAVREIGFLSFENLS